MKYQKRNAKRQSLLKSHLSPDPQQKKCLVDLTKEAKNFLAENYKTLIKEINCSWIGRVNIVKNSHTTQSNIQI